MDFSKEEYAYIKIASAEGIGVKSFYHLFRCFDTATDIWNALDNAPEKIAFIGSRVLQKLKQAKNIDIVALVEDWQKQGITPVCKISQFYPRALLDLFDAPPVLYCYGDISLLNTPSVAIVGARRSTRYGKEIALTMGRELSSAGLTVVSGFARGIDTEAQKGAIEKGRTIAVLGCGVDVCYPPENAELFKKLKSDHLVISEYLPGAQPLAQHFPARNRIISGLCEGVLLIEADEKSGAMITIDFALEQGRDVYAVPGNINSPVSRGTNRLIKEGAIMVLSSTDVLEHYGIYKEKTTSEAPILQLDMFEQAIVEALQQGDLSLEDLLAITDFSPASLNTYLTMLELRGIIIKLPCNVFGLKKG